MVATGATLRIKDDASPMCRKELLVVISALVKEWRGWFVVCAWLYWEEDRKWRMNGGGPGLLGGGGVFSHSGMNFEDEVTSQAVAEWLDNYPEEDGVREENRVLLSSFFTIFVALLITILTQDLSLQLLVGFFVLLPLGVIFEDIERILGFDFVVQP